MQNIECLVDVPEGFLVLADVDQLYRVLSNLIRNAKQAIEATTKQGTLELSARISANQWHIRVGDSGPGLPERAKEHLFEAFQGGARKGGTGLGLAISAELVRGHGGALELLRSDPQGTEFLIRLPVHSDLMEDA
jgi:signal transduction histidine kinase